MGPATLISLLILVVVASVVLKDVARMQAAAKPAPRPEDSPLIPRNINDPMVTGLQSQIDLLAQIVGTGVGTGIGRGLGQAAATAEVGVARGLGSQEISAQQAAELDRRSYGTASAASGAVGLNAGGLLGGIGEFISGTLVGIPGGLLSGGATAMRREMENADAAGVAKFRLEATDWGRGVFFGPIAIVPDRG